MNDIDSVEPSQKSEAYEDASGASPNRLYKRYIRWFKNKYGEEKKPLPFKDWLKWAKKKKMVKRHGVDGSEESVIEKSDKNKKRLALAIITISTVFIIAGLFNTKSA